VSHSPRNTTQTTEEMASILETGKSVVSSALLPALYAPAKHVSRRSTDRLDQACRAGESSLFVSGIDPGFATDALPIFLAGIGGRRQHTKMEIFSYEHYDDVETQFEWFGSDNLWTPRCRPIWRRAESLDTGAPPSKWWPQVLA